MTFKFFRSKIFQNFLFSYLGVVLITIIAGSITYYKFFQIVKEKTIESGISSVESGMEQLDARYKELDGLISLMASDEIITEILEKEAPLAPSDYYSIREIQNKLPGYKIINTFVQDIYLYYLKPDVIISTVYADVDPQRFYSQLFHYEGYDFASWKSELTSHYQYKSIWPEHLIVTNNVENTLITYVQSFPVELPTRFKCNVLLHIKAEDILKHFEASPAFLYGVFLIFNRSGELITTRSTMETIIEPELIANLPNQTLNEIVISGKKLTIISAISSITGLKAIAVIPSEIFLNQVAYIRTIYFSVSMSILIIMLIVGIFLAYRNSRPLDNLISLIQNDAARKGKAPVGSYEFLRNSVSNLIINNHELQEDIQRRLPLFQAGFIGRLLHGSFLQKENLIKASHLAQIDIEGKCFFVFVIRNSATEQGETELDCADSDLMQVLIHNIIRINLKLGHYSHSINLRETAVIVYFSMNKLEETRSRLKKQLKEIGSLIQREYGTTVEIGVSLPVYSTMDIALAFAMAQKTLSFFNPQEYFISFYETQQTQSSKGFFYPIELEYDLIRQTKTGNYREVEKILDKIFCVNFQKSNLSYTEVELLLSEIKATINKTTGSIAETITDEQSVYTPLLLELDKKNSTDSFFQIAKEIFKTICIKVNSRKSSHNETLLQNMKNLIAKQYTDPNLGLTSVATSLSITESYLSSFFKMQTGLKFSSYVENLRMSKVLELLKEEPNLSITIASKRVGYANDNTFYRACKRVFGTCPRELKNLANN